MVGQRIVKVPRELYDRAVRKQKAAKKRGINRTIFELCAKELYKNDYLKKEDQEYKFFKI